MSASHILRFCTPVLLLSSTSLFPLYANSASPDISAKAGKAEAESPAAFKLEYDKFTLDNGLQVILQVDKSDPIVAVTTVIHAGSNREKEGRTGFAHFFEHMAFNDSENVPRGWNRKVIPQWGGSRNGGTNSDMTIYYEIVPKDAFEKILWIDSDRLGYMINTVTKAALDKEKQVVKNEKRQRVDNAPYGYTSEVVRKNLYPKDHPYNWTVIGSLPDLQAATLDDLREFHTKYYGPNNATIAIVGDIDIADTKAKVQKWFGEIKRGNNVTPLTPRAGKLTENKKLYFEDNFAKLPELRMIFPTVELNHPDETALNVLAEIIAGSKSSEVYKQIVEKDKLAPRVSSYNSSMEIAGEFVFRIRGKSDSNLNDIKNSFETALKNFETNGVNQDDLTRIKAQQETKLYLSLETILGRSNALAYENTFSGEPDNLVKSADKIKALTADDINAVYDKYIKGKPAIITSFVPKGKTDLAVKDSKLASVWIEKVEKNVASEDVSEGEEAQYTKTPSSFDRSEPPFGKLPLVKMPDIWENKLANDANVLGIENSEIPIVSFDITIPGGSWNDGQEKAGLNSLLAVIMNEGTSKRKAAEFENAVGLLGSGIYVSSGREETTINVTTLSRNFEKIIPLVQELLTSPRLQDSEFGKVKSATITSLKGREANPNSIAALAFNKLIYGDKHPIGRANNGSISSVNNITLNDLKAAHQELLNTKPRFHIVGDIDAKRAAKGLNAIAKSFSPTGKKRIQHAIPEQQNAGKTFFIDVAGSKQSVLNIGKLTVSTTDNSANKLNYTNEKLGGGISGDLSQTLRIAKGYTYGAYSRISGGTIPQPFRISTSVRANATGASLETISDMVQKFGPEYSKNDVETTQQKLLKQNTRAFESLSAKQGTLRVISKYGKSQKYVEDDQQELLSMTLDDFKNTASTYLNEADMTYVIVGDKETQFEAVQKFSKDKGKGDVIELDIYGDVIPSE